MTQMRKKSADMIHDGEWLSTWRMLYSKHSRWEPCIRCGDARMRSSLYLSSLHKKHSKHNLHPTERTSRGGLVSTWHLRRWKSSALEEPRSTSSTLTSISVMLKPVLVPRSQDSGPDSSGMTQHLHHHHHELHQLRQIFTRFYHTPPLLCNVTILIQYNQINNKTAVIRSTGQPNSDLDRETVQTQLCTVEISHDSTCHILNVTLLYENDKISSYQKCLEYFLYNTPRQLTVVLTLTVTWLISHTPITCWPWRCIAAL